MSGYDDLMRLREQGLRTRLMLLESAIDEHRREVRDGIPPRWRAPEDPNVRLWKVLDNQRKSDG